MKEIEINIRGKAGTGKSTLAFAIEKMLAEAGVNNCEVKNKDDLERSEYYASSLHNLAGTKVVITQTQISHY